MTVRAKRSASTYSWLNSGHQLHLLFATAIIVGESSSTTSVLPEGPPPPLKIPTASWTAVIRIMTLPVRRVLSHCHQSVHPHFGIRIMKEIPTLLRPMTIAIMVVLQQQKLMRMASLLAIILAQSRPSFNYNIPATSVKHGINIRSHEWHIVMELLLQYVRGK